MGVDYDCAEHSIASTYFSQYEERKVIAGKLAETDAVVFKINAILNITAVLHDLTMVVVLSNNTYDRVYIFP